MSEPEGCHLGAGEGTARCLDTLMTVEAGATDTRGGCTLLDGNDLVGPPLVVGR